jgi:CDP-paratose 2-epimerase
VPLVVEDDQYMPKDEALRAHGVGEARPLDFHSPYGCSKGAADQYVIDYSRCYDLPTVVFRMSCIYGPHQFGTEDQGWVAHFLIRALQGREIMLYGDGRQVRDILFADDLVRAMLLAQQEINHVRGHAFNIGGGPGNAVSLLQVLESIESLHGRRPRTSFSAWRQGDQRYYVSDTRKFQSKTGWTPKINARDGLERLYQWLSAARSNKRNAPVPAAVHR